jgi:hypothetical protein
VETAANRRSVAGAGGGPMPGPETTWQRILSAF